MTLAVAYGLAIPLPFMAPLFALMLGAPPAPPMGPRALLGTVLIVTITLGVGLLIIPLLQNYRISAVMIVAVGLYLSNHLGINLGKGLVATLLTAGLTLISAAGTVSFELALTVIQAMLFSIALAIVCQWVVYPWFPEDQLPAKKTIDPDNGGEMHTRVVLRSTLIVLPVYLVALVNPAMYLSLIMKAVTLSQQGSMLDARSAGRELLGSTFLGGCMGIVFWYAMLIWPHLWMFFLWTFLFGIYFSCKIYAFIPSRYSGSFWLNTFVTMLILLGPAVEDSANGKDVNTAFLVRMSLFIAVTLYAWAAIYFLEQFFERRRIKTGKLAIPG